MSFLLIGIEAAYLLLIADLGQLRLALAALVGRVFAAGRKLAAFGQVERMRHRAGNRLQTLVGGRVKARNGNQDGTTREVFKIHPFLAPIKVTVLPLVKKIHGEKAQEIYRDLAKNFMVSYDESGNIGKRYRRADAVGTPFCLTVDDETINNRTVTLRNRDTMEQVTLKLDEVKAYIEEKIQF